MRRIIVLIVSLSLLAFSSLQAINVVFRYDDPTVRYDSAHCRIIRLFVEKQVPLSIAVIPCDTDEMPITPDNPDYLSLFTSDNNEICLHGLTHLYGEEGEFYTLSSDETYRRIRKGKDILSQYSRKEIVTFVPPYHVINAFVPECLKSNGINVISEDLNQDYSMLPNGVYLCPETLGELKDKGMWEMADRYIKQNVCLRHAVCVIAFHECDVPNEESLEQLECLLDYCKADPNVVLHTFSSLYESGNAADKRCYVANQLKSGLKKMVQPKGVLLPTWLCYCIHIANAIIYGLIAILGFLILLLLQKGKNRTAFLISIGLFVIMFCAAWYHWSTSLRLLLVAIGISIMPILYAMYRKNT